MENMNSLEYLFSFDFEKGCMNDYLINFCKETKTDFFYNSLGLFYADLYGQDVYYRVDIVDIKSKRKEVYYNPNDTMKRTFLVRKYPLREKALKVEPYENTYFIKAIFGDGNYITTRINGCKKTILNHYLGHIFDMSGDAEKETFVKCIDVEFLEVIK